MSQDPTPEPSASDGAPESPPALSQADLDGLAASLDGGEPGDRGIDGGKSEDPGAPLGANGRAADGPQSADGPATAAITMPNFDKVLQEAQASGIDLLRDVNLEVKIELGRSRLLVEDVLKLVEGSVVELDKLAGDPVDVFVNDRLVARGEVLVLNENFCVRVNEIIQSSREEDL